MNNNSDTEIVGSLSSMLKTWEGNCNTGNYFPAKIISNSIFLAIFLAGFLSQLVGLPATWRLAKERSAFLIMFHANLGHCLLLLFYIVIGLEYFLVGNSLVFPLRVDAFYYNLINSLIGLCYIILALNRFVAVFLPTYYDQIFSGRRTKQWIGACWLLAAMYSALLMSKPELHPYHCINEIVVVQMITTQQELAQQSSFVIMVWIIRKLVGPFFALVPMALYLVVFIRMFAEHLQNGQSSASAASPDMHRERARLFLISFLSTLPFFVQTLFSHVQYLLGIPVLPSWNALVQKVFFVLFQIHEPFLLGWLSADFWKELRRDWDRVAALIMIKPKQNQLQINHSNTVPIAATTPASQQAWTN